MSGLVTVHSAGSKKQKVPCPHRQSAGHGTFCVWERYTSIEVYHTRLCTKVVCQRRLCSFGISVIIEERNNLLTFPCSHNASFWVLRINSHLYRCSLAHERIEPKPMGLSIISVFSNLILVPDHPRINYIFISKVIGTHVEFYVNPFYCSNFSGNNLSVFQQVCFADVCNPCYPDNCDSNKPRSYECPDSNLLIGDRNQKSNKNPNSTKNMEQIFRKELMDFFHGKTLPFSVDNSICSIVSYALCFFKPSQVIGETT